MRYRATVPDMVDLDDVVLAYEALRRAREDTAEAMVRRDKALAAWWASSGIPKAHVPEVLVQRLTEAGWDDHALRLAGVSSGSIALALRQVRPG